MAPDDSITSTADVGGNSYLPRGTSGDIERLTRGERGVALVKKLRYCSANVKVTASCISITTASSSLSTFADCANLTFPKNKVQNVCKRQSLPFYTTSTGRPQTFEPSKVGRRTKNDGQK